MSIPQLQELIRKARIEIDNCKKLKVQIRKVSNLLVNCNKYLSSASSSLDAGLRINGSSVDSNRSLPQRVDKINSYNSNLDSCFSIIDAYIIKLENQILGWQAEIERIKEEQERQAYIERLENLYLK